MSNLEELNAILNSAVQLKEMIKVPKRVNGIANYVAQHFRETVEPMGFKSFLVAVDREACALYKRAVSKGHEHEEIRRNTQVKTPSKNTRSYRMKVGRSELCFLTTTNMERHQCIL